MPRCRFCWNANPHGDSALECELTGKIISYEQASRQTKCKNWVLCQCEEKDYMDIFAEIPYRTRIVKPKNNTYEKLRLFDLKDLIKEKNK